MSWQGHYLDGKSPQRRAAQIYIGRAGLEIITDDGATRRWPLAEIRQTQGSYTGEPVRLERGRATSEILIVDDVAFLAALRDTIPEFKRRFHDPRRRRLRVQLTAAAAVAAVAMAAALYVWGIPAMAMVAARYVPIAWEERLGEEVFARARVSLRERRCQDPERQKVIDGIVATLMATRPENPYNLRVTVADWPEVNAFALPGGRIVVLRGLLDITETAEMLAGVLAHEVQHITRRHTTRAIIQHASTGLMVAAISGDVSGLAAFGLEGARVVGALNYSRRAEEEADEEGMRMILDARVDPAGMIAFFEHMLRARGGDPGGAGGALRYLSTHPGASERIARLRELARQPAPPPVKLLPDYDWKDMKRVCGGA